MTYQTKLARARAILEAVNASSEVKVDIVAFEKKLQELGAVNDETLVEASWEDLQVCGLPKLIAKQIANEFRTKEKSENHVSAKKANSMSFEELFSAYDPDPVVGPSEVTKKLLEISKGKRCVIFLDSGKVDAAASTTMLQMNLRGLPEVATHRLSDDRVVPVYKVGERPVAQEFEVNPVFHNEVLRSGVCSQTLRSWEPVSHRTRQLVYLAVTRTHELRAQSVTDAHSILDYITAGEGTLSLRTPKAVLLLKELEQRNEAPRLCTCASVTRSNHPFSSSV